MAPIDPFDAAVAHHRAGRLAEAEGLYREILSTNSADGNAWFGLGSLALHVGKLEVACDLMGQATRFVPDRAAYYAELAHAFLGLGRVAQARDALVKAYALAPERPEHAEALARIAVAEGAAGDLTSLGHAREQALLEIAGRLRALGRRRASAALYQRAIELYPDRAHIHGELGLVLFELSKLDEAEASFRRAIALDPSAHRVHCHLGNTLGAAGRHEEAVASYRRAIELAPDDPLALGNLVFTLAFHPACGPEQVLAEARDWERRHATPLAVEIVRTPRDRAPERRLRVGYVSPHFLDHCQSLFTVPLLQHHDHRDFEVFLYSGVTSPDAVTARLRGYADQWRDIAALDDRAAAALVREDEIDILVDLTMHMEGSRLRLFARRPAPVQIAWLAYPGTTGLGAIDYRVTDPLLDPPADDPGPYAERPLRLPDTFWCYDPLTSEPDPGPLPALAAGLVRFGCLNNFLKTNDEVIDLWAAVLREVGGARFVLLAPVDARARVLRRFAAQGVDPQRVDFVDLRPRPAYLASYRSIDIGLDTVPYNGHTTSLDAFWMGVPVVTLVGRSVVGRAGRAFAHHLGLEGRLVARSPGEFVTAAAHLARDLDGLAALRRELRARMAGSPLMDGARFARGLEAAYRAAWRGFCSLE